MINKLVTEAVERSKEMKNLSDAVMESVERFFIDESIDKEINNESDKEDKTMSDKPIIEKLSESELNEILNQLNEESEIDFEETEEDEDMNEGDDAMDISDLEKEIHGDEEEAESEESEEGDEDSEEEEMNEMEEEDDISFMRKMQEELSKRIEKAEGKKVEDQMEEGFHNYMKEGFGEAYKEEMDEGTISSLKEKYQKRSAMDEMHKGNLGSQTIDKLHKGDLDSNTIEEEMDDKEEDSIDERHGITHGLSRKTGGGTIPKEGTDYRKNQKRSAMRESEEKWQKRVDTYIQENKEMNAKIKNLQKQLQEQKNVAKQLQESKEIAEYKLHESKLWNTCLYEGVFNSKEEKVALLESFKNSGSFKEKIALKDRIINESKSIQENEELSDVLNAGQVMGESTAKHTDVNPISEGLKKYRETFFEHINHKSKTSNI